MLLGAMQMRSSMDAQENLRTIENACADAHQKGVGYLQVPEMAVMFAEDHHGLRTFVRDEPKRQLLRWRKWRKASVILAYGIDGGG